MSFTVFLQWFRNGEAAGVPFEAVREAFRDAICLEAEDVWELEYDPRNTSSLYITRCLTSPALVHNISVDRPCGSDRLWQALFALLTHDAGVFYSPDSRPLVVHASASLHLPPGMIDALGEPRIVSSWRDITDALSEPELGAAHVGSRGARG